MLGFQQREPDPGPNWATHWSVGWVSEVFTAPRHQGPHLENGNNDFCPVCSLKWRKMGRCFVTCKKKTLPLCAGIVVDGVLPTDLAPHGGSQACWPSPGVCRATSGSMEWRPILKLLAGDPESGRGSEKEVFALPGVAWEQKNTLMRVNASSALCARHTSKNFPCLD